MVLSKLLRPSLCWALRISLVSARSATNLWLRGQSWSTLLFLATWRALTFIANHQCLADICGDSMAVQTRTLALFNYHPQFQSIKLGLVTEENSSFSAKKKKSDCAGDIATFRDLLMKVSSTVWSDGKGLKQTLRPSGLFSFHSCPFRRTFWNSIH